MHTSKKGKGFTLLELMIVVAVIGTLAAISIPSYMSHMVKVRRGSAAACLMEQAQFAERFYTTNMTYSGLDSAGSGISPTRFSCIQDLQNNNGFYTFRVVESTDKTFTLTARPEDKQKDPKCGALTIKHTGAKEVTGTDSVSHCF